MKNVWHLFCSQVSALRWWLLAWIAALAAWAVARWTYLTKWRDSWAARDDFYWYGLLIFSALLVASVLHLHPPAKRVAGWRGWPLRGWKVPTAQFIFVLVFLVLLPGAAEMLFLLHPRLDGFMANGIVQWLSRSLWLLPFALGLAACSHSLRRFILDALIFTAIVIGAFTLINASRRWGFDPMRSLDRDYLVYRWFIPCFFGGVLLVWPSVSSRLVPAALGRWFFFTAPAIYVGALMVVNADSQRYPDPDYIPAVTGNAELAERIELRLSREPLWISESGSSPSAGVNAKVESEGLRPNESAEITFWKQRLHGDGITVTNESSAGGIARGTLGDTSWPQWPGGSREARSGPVATMNIIFGPLDKLRLLHRKPCRLEATATVSVQRSTVVARLPFLMGAKWEKPDRELTVEFIGPGSDAAQRTIKQASPDCALVTSVTYRRFGDAAAEPYPAVLVVHKPSGYRLKPASYTSEGERDQYTCSRSTRFICSFQRNTDKHSLALPLRALSHPEEFEFILRGTESLGSVAREVTVDGFQLLSVRGQPVEIAVPDKARPDAVESFLRELEVYCKDDRDAGISPVLRKCGPDILPALVEFSLRNPDSPLNDSLFNYTGGLIPALFKPEQQDHRMAFFKSFGRRGLFISVDTATPQITSALLAEGLAWVKEDPDNRLTLSWLYQMRNEQVPALYPAIRRFLEKEGAKAPWRHWLHMPGLEPPAIVDPPMVSVPRGPSPVTEGEFYRVPMLQLTGPQDSYRDAVKQGKEWASRLGSVIAASDVPEDVITLWLKAWPDVSDCPSDPKAARAWIQANADRLHLNPETRRYDLR